MRRSTHALVLIAVLVVAGCGGRPMSTATAMPETTAASAATPRPAASAPTAPTPQPTTSPTQLLVEYLTERVAATPDDPETQRELGLALLQRIRETADPSLYPVAESALAAARRFAPDDPLTPVGLGALQLGRHEFAAALETGRAALEIESGYPPARGIVVDALIELGRYDEAFAEAEALAAASPDLPALARLSYARELRGDLPGALDAMRRAAGSPGLAPENTAFATALVGQLQRLTGDPAGAQASYQRALAIVPDHAPSIAGLGRLALGDGDLAVAADEFGRAAAIVPLPEHVVALGETLEAAGDTGGARRQYELARAEVALFRASGVVVDLELALFEADHGDAAKALEYAETAYAATPTIRAADARAWALHRLGRDTEAAGWAADALRLGSRDPLLRFHAGAIAAALGDADTARADLEMALAIDPGFSATGAAEARAILEDLGAR
jgi:tetratricopeptide (TPR) repeat protein